MTEFHKRRDSDGDKALMVWWTQCADSDNRRRGFVYHSPEHPPGNNRNLKCDEGCNGWHSIDGEIDLMLKSLQQLFLLDDLADI